MSTPFEIVTAALQNPKGLEIQSFMTPTSDALMEFYEKELVGQIISCPGYFMIITDVTEYSGDRSCTIKVKYEIDEIVVVFKPLEPKNPDDLKVHQYRFACSAYLDRVLALMRKLKGSLPAAKDWEKYEEIYPNLSKEILIRGEIEGDKGDYEVTFCLEGKRDYVGDNTIYKLVAIITESNHHYHMRMDIIGEKFEKMISEHTTKKQKLNPENEN